jgi:CRISPR/Cas system-associated exonuclease Cas4 (RecB family)
MNERQKMPNAAALAKPAAWSYSRLNDFESCPRRYVETKILKKWPEERSAQLELGDEIHAAMAATLQHGTPLPSSFAVFQPWIDSVNKTPGELLVEERCKFAITRDFKPTPWFSDKVWLRAIGDAVKLDSDVALAVDWKTGKSLNADTLQLSLLSLVLLASFPKLQCVRADFIFLNEDSQITEVIYRDEMADKWAEIIPRVQKLETATREDNFPPRPGRFCQSWCPVQTCEYHGQKC